MLGENGTSMDRRGFLGLVGAGVLATTIGGVTGCSSPSAPQTGSALGNGEFAGVLPAHVPVEFGKPDLAGVNGSPAAYLRYPSQLVQAIKDKPGGGGQLTAMTPSFWPVPPGLGQNAYYDAVNSKLGATIKFEQVSGNDYQQKLSAMMAARQVPEIVVMPSFTVPPRFTEGVGTVFTDLTDLLKGDEVRKYPMLANIPTDNWLGCAFNKRLYGVPFPGSPFAETIFYRKDVFERLGVAPPKSAAEFEQLCKKITDPAARQWALGDVFRAMVRMFGGKGDWSRDASGKVVNQLETEAYVEAVSFSRSLCAAGYAHPDYVAGALSGTSKHKELFASGQMLMVQDGVGAWKEALAAQRPSNPSFDMAALPLFNHDGGKPTYPVSTPTSMITMFRKDLPRERVEELLRIVNFAASPIGTQEYHLVNYGTDGTHSTRDAQGEPQLNDLGRKEITLTYGFFAGPPQIITNPAYPDFVKAQHAWYADTYSHQIKPLEFGLKVDEPAEFSKLGKEFQDKTFDIIFGRTPVEDVTKLADEWRRKGGDQLREFHTKVLADAGR
ncbi:extracellular solute-binding protein [Lentzea sp. NPDC051213]|uniref:extracellular solute-binding protein n=1 Tax=Lentzea sp. NPDC051213 TaxID=3364126 RepID=UPI0037A33509